MDQVKKGLNMETIILWLRAIIGCFYSSVLKEDCRTVKVNMHEVYSIASLMLFKKNFAVSQVLWSGMCKLQTMFIAS